MIKKLGKAFLRIERACSAFSQVLKAGGINTIKVSQVQKDDALSGKNIVITGGSSGIGLAIAKKSIEAGAKVAAQETRNKRVGIIGTVGTVGSGIHASYLKELDPEITVIGKACPLFVPLVEEGWYHDPVTEEVARRYLKELQEQEIDTLILGCTHYPLLRSTIRKIMGEEVCLVNPAYETALELKKLLSRLDLASNEVAQEEFPYRFYVSDLAEKFKDFANSILPYNVEKTQKIDIEKY